MKQIFLTVLFLSGTELTDPHFWAYQKYMFFSDGFQTTPDFVNMKVNTDLPFSIQTECKSLTET